MKVLLGLASVGAVLCVVAIAQSDTPKVRRVRAAHAVPAQAPTPEPTSPTIGDDVRLDDSDGYHSVFVCSSESALAAARKASQSGDPHGTNALIDTGQMFSCPTGTRARVIDLGQWFSDHAEVRIQSGKHTGRAVWVTMTQMKRISSKN